MIRPVSVLSYGLSLLMARTNLIFAMEPPARSYQRLQTISSSIFLHFLLNGSTVMCPLEITVTAR